MSKHGDLIESSSYCAGVNTHPLLMELNERVSFLSNAVNRGTYRGVNDTRPPYREVYLTFQSTEDEYTFRNSAVSGIEFYKGESSLFSSFLIVSVGDLILAGYIKINSIDFIRIYKGIDPQWHHAFFKQALNILTYNDSKNPGLYWTGNPTYPAKRIYESSFVGDYPMPISNVSVFAFGRLFSATPNELVYASDYIYAQGISLEKREAVLRFQESTYPSSGDGFGAPTNMGTITGMITVPQSNTINGYGDILVTCSNGVFSISPNNKVRNEWTNDPSMQRNVFEGKGCVAHKSITLFNNQIVYRDSSCEYSSLNLDIARYQSNQEFAAISREVERYTDYDNDSDDIQYCCSATTNKRFLSSVCHRKETSISSGTHRYGMGMISACLQKKNGASFLSWEGLWTGIRPTGIVTTNVGNIKRTYISSFDADKQNRIYFLDEKNRGDDYSLSNGPSRIKSKFTYSSLFSDIGAQSPLLKKKLKKIELMMTDSNLDNPSVSFNLDDTREFTNVKVQLTETISSCQLGTVRMVSHDIESDNTAYLFSVHFEMRGLAQVVKMVFSGSITESKEGFNQAKCNKTETSSFSFCFTDPCKSKEINNFDYNIYGQ